MKKSTKQTLMTVIIILCAGTLAIVLLNRTPPTDADTTKCIGDNSVLYSRLGCHFCEVQEDIFGENYQYLTVVDCFFDEAKCSDITGTPTWVIKGKQYVGVQTFAKLKDLTGC